MIKRKMDPEVRRKRLNALYEIRNENLAKLRKRHAGFTELVKEYTSFDDFMRDWYEKMALFGTEVDQGSESISLRIQIDYTDYEEYYIIMGKDGHLAIDPEVMWQDMCTNTLTNIFTGENVDF